ncbi:MAG: sulfotransferase domain-containing protein [Phycisphaerales bacterium]
MITWIASYPKSGNTWVRFLLHNALHEPTDELTLVEERIPYVLRVRDRYRPESEREDLLKTHLLRRDEHPFVAHTRRAIYVIRDPRDVLMSNLNYRRLRRSEAETGVREMTDADYARAFIDAGGDPVWAGNQLGTWADNAESWARGAGFPVLLVRYEDLGADAHAELARMLAFLERPTDEGVIARAVETSSFARLREGEARRRGDTPGEAPYFFNRGVSGASLDELIAPGLDAAFDQVFGEAMGAFGYPLRAR